MFNMDTQNVLYLFIRYVRTSKDDSDKKKKKNNSKENKENIFYIKNMKLISKSINTFSL